MLPTAITIKKECFEDWDLLSDYEKEELLCDYLSDTYGFLHEGFSYEETEETIVIDHIKWEVDEEVEDYEED